jgi:ABC-2 type transport system ATP-binding protein
VSTPESRDGASAIEVSELRVRRGGNLVLPRLTLSVPRGSVTGLLGPSGCGKTTLMRSIVGVQIVESGSVRVLGEPAGSAGLRSRVGYVTQAPSVYWDLSVHENLRFFARVLGAPPGRIDEVIEAVSLGSFAEREVRDQSGGQRARVSLASALLGDPDVLVLDEPTVGLDPLLRQDLWAMFKRLSSEGKALLISSHVMDEAANCDRLALMREGELLAVETPDELLARTGTKEIGAAFVRLIREAEGRGEEAEGRGEAGG